MNQINGFSSTDNPFRPEGLASFATVREKVTVELSGTRQRDTLSALRVIEKRLAMDFAATPATAETVRKLFDETCAVQLGLSGKRFANVRSLVIQAIQRFGMRRRCLTKGNPFDAAWSTLLGRIPKTVCRHGLSRLAHFGSATGIGPDAVTVAILLDFHAALEAECLVKLPRAILKRTIALWNICGRTVPGWPPVVLSSPFATDPDTMPLERFPAAFQADVARWTNRTSRPDPLDALAPVRALRPTTIKGHVVLIRRFASALVRRNRVAIEDLTGLRVFFEGDNVKEGLRHFLKGEGAGSAAPTQTAHKIATLLLHIARHHLRLDAQVIEAISSLCRRLDPQSPRTMGRRNRDRLDQFDDPHNVQRLLAFPQDEAERALRRRNPLRRAKGIERALAVALLIDTGLRIQNLRTLRLDANVRRIQDRVFLSIDGAAVKNGMALEHELPAETVALLDLFLLTHRPVVPGHQGPYIFPGQDGGPKSDRAMRTTISEPIRKHTGLVLSPHLFRHAIAKILVEADPSLCVAVSRHLGHKSINMTLQSYLGSETRAASRQFNRILRGVRDNPTPSEV